MRTITGAEVRIPAPLMATQVSETPSLSARRVRPEHASEVSTIPDSGSRAVQVTATDELFQPCSLGGGERVAATTGGVLSRRDHFPV